MPENEDKKITARGYEVPPAVKRKIGSVTQAIGNSANLPQRPFDRFRETMRELKSGSNPGLMNPFERESDQVRHMEDVKKKK